MIKPSNKELRLHKNCQLYAFLLISQGKEVPEEIQECADSYDYDYLVECAAQLSAELKDLESDIFEKIVNNKESKEACELAQWLKMHQEADRLSKELVQTCL